MGGAQLADKSIDGKMGLILNYLEHSLLLEQGERSRYRDWPRAGRPGGRSSSLCRVKIFVFSTPSRQILGAHPASYPMGTGGSFFGDKVAGVCS
jgi:hypothetical protein